MALTLTRKEMFHVLFELKKSSRDEKKRHFQNYIMSKLSIKDYEIHVKKTIEKQITFFCMQVFSRYDQCNRKTERFLTNDEKWLEQNVIISITIVKETNAAPSTSDIKKKLDRPAHLFESSSERTKHRKTADLR